MIHLVKALWHSLAFHRKVIILYQVIISIFIEKLSNSNVQIAMKIAQPCFEAFSLWVFHELSPSVKQKKMPSLHRRYFIIYLADGHQICRAHSCQL